MPLFEIHFLRSLSINFFKPLFLIYSWFSISLMPYLVRYLLSRCLRRSQGKSIQLKQKSPWRLMQSRNRHCARVFGMFCSASRQPWQGFLGRKCTLQIAQFIPHAAIKFLLMKWGIFLRKYYMIKGFCPTFDCFETDRLNDFFRHKVNFTL